MPRGGRREGAGRPKGTGKFGEPTKAVRIPVSQISRIMSFIDKKGMVLPLYETQVQAGFPTPVDDATAEKFDLLSYLIPRPTSTHLVRVSGESMIEAGIFSGDILVVDRSLEPKINDIVIAIVDEEFTVKRLIMKDDQYELKAENREFENIKLGSLSELKLWGVVQNVIRKVY